VNIDYHVAFQGHYYSVPHTLVGQEVRMRATERNAGDSFTAASRWLFIH